MKIEVFQSFPVGVLRYSSTRRSYSIKTKISLPSGLLNNGVAKGP